MKCWMYFSVVYKLRHDRHIKPWAHTAQPNSRYSPVKHTFSKSYRYRYPWLWSTVIYTLPSFGSSDKLSPQYNTKWPCSCLAAVAVDIFLNTNFCRYNNFWYNFFFPFIVFLLPYSHLRRDISWGWIYRNLLRHRLSYLVLMRWYNQTLQRL